MRNGTLGRVLAITMSCMICLCFSLQDIVAYAEDGVIQDTSQQQEDQVDNQSDTQIDNLNNSGNTSADINETEVSNGPNTTTQEASETSETTDQKDTVVPAVDRRIVPWDVLKTWKKGWHTYNGFKYYCKKNKKLTKGWKTIKRKKYYFDTSNGAMYTYFKTIGKYNYYFNGNGVMKKGWITFSEGKRYFNSKGRMVTGRVKIKRKYYNFDKATGFYMNPKSNVAYSVPVLTFHRIVEDRVKRRMYPNDQWTAAVSDFTNEIKYLKQNGYHSVTMDEFNAWYRGKIELDRKAVVLTFDDGDYEFYYLVAPILKQYGFSATMFVIGAYTEDTTADYVADGSRHRLGWDVINKMKTEYPNLSIQSHSYNIHHYVGDKMAVYTKTLNELREDFANTNSEFTYMAWPYGYYSNEAVQAFKESHYTLGFNFGRYRNASRADEPWSIYRVKVNGQVTMSEFKKMLS